MSEPQINTINISVANLSDLKPLAAFARRTYREAYEQDVGKARIDAHLEIQMTDEQFRQMMSRDVFLLAWTSDQLVGFAQLGKVPGSYGDYLREFDLEAGELRRLYVLAEHQGKGIGKKLLYRALEDPLLEHCNVYLTTWEANYGAQALYKSFGFVKVGQIPEENSEGEIEGYEHIMLKRA